MVIEKIDRINYLARKSRTDEGLTEDEKSEQKILRAEYIAEWREGAKQVLDNTYVLDENGKERKLSKKVEK